MGTTAWLKPQRRSILLLTCSLALLLASCTSSAPSSSSSPTSPTSPDVATDTAAPNDGVADNATTDSVAADPPPMTTAANPDSLLANVTAVDVTGEPGAYRFSVTIQSPDTGCDQYSDWWEVVSADGDLIHRRVLLHSHVDEQPFTRSSGPVEIESEDPVIVRAHMHPHGYGGQAFEGTVSGGFTVATLPEGFAAALSEQSPLPTGCTF